MAGCLQSEIESALMQCKQCLDNAKKTNDEYRKILYSAAGMYLIVQKLELDPSSPYHIRIDRNIAAHDIRFGPHAMANFEKFSVYLEQLANGSLHSFQQVPQKKSGRTKKTYASEVHTDSEKTTIAETLKYMTMIQQNQKERKSTKNDPLLFERCALNYFTIRLGNCFLTLNTDKTKLAHKKINFLDNNKENKKNVATIIQRRHTLTHLVKNNPSISLSNLMKKYADVAKSQKEIVSKILPSQPTAKSKRNLENKKTLREQQRQQKISQQRTKLDAIRKDLSWQIQYLSLFSPARNELLLKIENACKLDIKSLLSLALISTGSSSIEQSRDTNLLSAVLEFTLLYSDFSRCYIKYIALAKTQVTSRSGKNSPPQKFSDPHRRSTKHYQPTPGTRTPYVRANTQSNPFAESSIDDNPFDSAASQPVSSSLDFLSTATSTPASFGGCINPFAEDIPFTTFQLAPSESAESSSFSFSGASSSATAASSQSPTTFTFDFTSDSPLSTPKDDEVFQFGEKPDRKKIIAQSQYKRKTKVETTSRKIDLINALFKFINHVKSRVDNKIGLTSNIQKACTDLANLTALQIKRDFIATKADWTETPLQTKFAITFLMAVNTPLQHPLFKSKVKALFGQNLKKPIVCLSLLYRYCGNTEHRNILASLKNTLIDAYRNFFTNETDYIIGKNLYDIIEHCVSQSLITGQETTTFDIQAIEFKQTQKLPSFFKFLWASTYDTNMINQGAASRIVTKLYPCLTSPLVTPCLQMSPLAQFLILDSVASAQIPALYYLPKLQQKKIFTKNYVSKYFLTLTTTSSDSAFIYLLICLAHFLTIKPFKEYDPLLPKFYEKNQLTLRIAYHAISVNSIIDKDRWLPVWQQADKHLQTIHSPQPETINTIKQTCLKFLPVDEKAFDCITACNRLRVFFRYLFDNYHKNDRTKQDLPESILAQIDALFQKHEAHFQPAIASVPAERKSTTQTQQQKKSPPNRRGRNTNHGRGGRNNRNRRRRGRRR